MARKNGMACLENWEAVLKRFLHAKIARSRTLRAIVILEYYFLSLSFGGFPLGPLALVPEVSVALALSILFSLFVLDNSCFVCASSDFAPVSSEEAALEEACAALDFGWKPTVRLGS